MSGTLFQKADTLAGVAVDVNILTSAAFTAKVVVLSNDHASNTYTITLQGTSSTLLPGEVAVYTGNIKKVTLDGTGAYRLFASEDASILPTLLKPPGVSAGSISTADLADGILSADAAGRAKMADDYFTNAQFVAGAGGKFAPSCLDATACANVFANNALTAAKLEAGAAAAGIDGGDVRFSATGATFGALPVVYAHALPDATGNVDIIVDQKVHIIQAWLHQSAAGNVADSARLFNGAGAITAALNYTASAGAVVPAQSLDATNRIVAAGGTLRVTVDSTAGDTTGTFYCLAVPVA